MKLKTFHAETMMAAMQKVKAELGSDAIIVNSSEENGMVKITAAIEQDALPAIKTEAVITPEQPKIKVTIPKDLQDEAIEESDIQTVITDAMLRHRVPTRVSEKIISTALTMPGENPRQVFEATLNKLFDFRRETSAKSSRKIILVGAPGAGKTLMTAKFAAKFSLEGETPTIITTDYSRAGGIEQLSAFLNILKLPLSVAKTAKDLTEIVAKAKDSKQVIIDTGGLNPFDPSEMKFLANLIKASDFEPALVLPANTDAEEAAEMAQAFSILGTKQIIPTRLDFARYLGGMLNAADRGNLYFSESSHNPKVADGILYLNPSVLANLLIPKNNKKG